MYIIPDPNDIENSLRITSQWNLKFEYNDFFNPDLLDDKEHLNDRISMYKSLNRELNGDILHGVFYDIAANSSDRRIREISEMRMISSMEIASELNCRAVIFHTNTIPGFELPFYLDRWCQYYVNIYTRLCREYPHLEVYVENMFDNKPDMLIRLAQQMEGTENFGVCYDVAHSNVHNIPMSDWMTPLSGYIKHLHINDNDGTGDYHCSLGNGTIKWDEYFGYIDSLGIEASMLIEVNGTIKQDDSLRFLKERGYIG